MSNPKSKFVRELISIIQSREDKGQAMQDVAASTDNDGLKEILNDRAEAHRELNSKLTKELLLLNKYADTNESLVNLIYEAWSNIEPDFFIKNKQCKLIDLLKKDILVYKEFLRIVNSNDLSKELKEQLFQD